MTVTYNVTSTGEGAPATSPNQTQTLIVVRDFQPGQLVKIVFLTVQQSRQLPAIPDDALQIAIAPAGGL